LPCAHANQESRVSAPGAHAANDPIEKLTPVLSIGVHTNARPYCVLFGLQEKNKTSLERAEWIFVSHSWLAAE
jgi:hypothetical protein